MRELERWLKECVAAGRFLPPGSPDRRALAALLEEWNSRLARHDHRREGLDRLAGFDPSAGVVLDVPCPYPGLDAYRADDRKTFFGRDALARDYAKRLVDGRIFLIVGASGSGESSLALAGIQPLLPEQSSQLAVSRGLHTGRDAVAGARPVGGGDDG